ncbi:MAG: 50S ribosomal protein L35 [Candidatus Magasanikiibacteriota bacterium]
MPKAKTHKATAKRFAVKKSSSGVKFIKRTNGQDHFNSRESGKTRRNKRSDKTMSNTMRDTISRAIKNF